LCNERNAKKAHKSECLVHKANKVSRKLAFSNFQKQCLDSISLFFNDISNIFQDLISEVTQINQKGKILAVFFYQEFCFSFQVSSF